MKLHLPGKLRSSLLACMCSVAAMGRTLCTATLLGGAVAASFSGQSWATDYHLGSTTQSDGTYAGSLTLSSNDYNNHCIVLGSNTSETTTTAPDSVLTTSATYTITVAEDESYTATAIRENPNYMGTSTLVKAGDGTLTISGYNRWGINNDGDDYQVAAGYQLDKYEVQDGTLVLEGSNRDATNYPSLPSIPICPGGSIQVNKGGKLVIASTTTDALGRGNNRVLVTLGDDTTSTDTATLEINSLITIDGALTLKGNTQIAKYSEASAGDVIGIDLVGGSIITASGANNVISTAVYEREGTSTFALANEGDSLSLAGGLGQRATATGTYKKTGAGTLSMANLVLKGSLDVEAGKVYIGTTGSNATSSIGGTLTLHEQSEVTLNESTNLSKLDNSGSLIVKADTSISDFYLSSTGTISVNNGIRLTIKDVSRDNDATDKNTHTWNLLNRWDAQEGDTGLIVYQKDFNADGAGNADSHITGRYKIAGSMVVNSYPDEKTTTIDAHAYLHITGNLQMQTKQTLTVSGSGMLVIDGTLELGHQNGWDATAGDTWGKLNLEEGAKAYANTLKFMNNKSGTVATVTQGSLYIGKGGIVNEVSTDTTALLVFNGGTLGAADANWGDHTGWTSAHNVKLEKSGSNLTVDTTRYEWSTPEGATDGTWVDNGYGADITLTGNVVADSGAALTVVGAGKLHLLGDANSLKTLYMGDGTNGAHLVIGSGSDTASVMVERIDLYTGASTLTINSGSTLSLGSNGINPVANNSGTLKVTVNGGTITGASAWGTPAATTSFTFNGGVVDAKYELNLNGNVSVAQGTILTVKGDSDNAGLAKSGTLTNMGTLQINTNTTTKTYDKASTGSIKVADSTTLTITDTSSYITHHGNNTSGKSNLWSLLTAADASNTGNGGKVVLGSENSAANTTFYGDGNYKYDETNAPQTIKGHYVLNGSVAMNRWAMTTTSTIASTGSLEVTKGAYLASRQEWNVQGALTVGETLSLGYSGAENSTTGTGDNQYYGRLNIDGGTVTANQLHFNTGTDSSYTSGLTLSNGGSLLLGSGGLTAGTDKTPTIVLSSGTLGVKDGATSWSSSLSMTLGGVAGSSLTIDSGAAITLSGTATLNGTITNKGSLTLSGTLLVDKYSNLIVTGGAYSDAENGNGFYGGNYWLVQGQETTNGDATVTPSLTLTATTATVTGFADPVAVSSDNNGGAYVTLTSTVYEVNNGTVTFSTAKEDATGIQLNGGTLSFSASDIGDAYTSWDVNDSGDHNKERLPVTVAQNSGIHLNEGALVDAKLLTVKDDSKITLTGSGTYRLGIGSYDADVAVLDLAALKDSTKWTGTISTTDRDSWGAGTWLSGQDLSILGNEKSTIEIRGTWGYFKDGTIGSNIKLTNTQNWDALRFDSLDSSKTEHNYTFTGDVSGTGNLVRTADGSAENGDTMNFSFSGDVSGWSGDFLFSNSKGVTNVTFTGDATDVDIDLRGSGAAERNLTFDHDKNATVDGSIEGNANVTYKGTGTTTVTNSASNYSGTTTVEAGKVVVSSAVKLGTGEVTVKGGSLQLNSGATVQSTVHLKNNSTEVATLSKKEGGNLWYENVVISSEGISAAEDSNGEAFTNAAIKNITITVSDSAADGKAFAIEGVTVTNCTFDLNAALTVGESTAFTNTTVDIDAAGALIYEGSAALALGTGANTLTLDTTEGAKVNLNGATLTSTQLQGSFSGTMILEAGATLLAQLADIKTPITLTFDFTSGTTSSPASLSGDELLQNSAITANTPADDGISLANEVTPTTSGLTFTLGSSFTNMGYTLAANEDGTYTLSTSDAIPEPTTATLSLLALAALAARRRK